MDPMAAITIIARATKALDESLTVYPWPAGLADSLREERDQAWEAIGDLEEWFARGGSGPRDHYHTAYAEFRKALLENGARGGIGWGFQPWRK